MKTVKIKLIFFFTIFVLISTEFFTQTNGYDISFGQGGIVTTAFNVSGASKSYASVIQNDGKIIAVGSSNSSFAIARYNSDGSLDNTFGAGDLLQHQLELQLQS